jgi:hypothetical protein
MQVKGYIPVQAGLALAVQGPTFSKSQINQVPDVLMIENNTYTSSVASFPAGATSTATSITVHFDADPGGTGSFTNDAIASVTLVAGGQAFVNIDGAGIDKQAGGQLRLRTIAASFPGLLQITPLYRYNGVQ